jgi:putative DNA primase/helicase
MFEITIVDSSNNEAVQSFEEIDEFFTFIASVKNANTNNTYIFGKAYESEVFSTQFLIINVKGITKFDNLAYYHYVHLKNVGGDEYVVAPIEKSLDGKQLENARVALADELGIKSNSQPVVVQNEPLIIDAECLKKAEVNIGCFSFPPPFTFLPTSIAKKVEQNNGYEFNVDDSNQESIMKLFDNHIKFVGKEFFFYNPDTGVWDRKSESIVKRFIANEFFEGKAELKDVNEVFNSLKVSVADDAIQQDKSCHVLALQNCAFDPISGRKLGFHHSYYALGSLQFSYNANATCPLWLNFLQEIFGQDDDCEQKIALLQEFMGLSLTKVVKHEMMLFLIGAGANGKSVILAIVTALLGHRNISNVSLKDFDGKYKLAYLNNKLVNIDSDIDKDAIKSDAMFKRIISGETITTEYKYGSVLEMTPHVKIWAAGNHMPTITHSCHATYRRIAPIEFNRTFTKDEQNPYLINDLRTELSGIFNWAIKGLVRCQANDYKLTIPASSEALIEEFELSNNPVKRFVRDCIEPLKAGSNHNKGIKSTELYKIFVKYIEDNAYIGLTNVKFGVAMKALGFESKISHGPRYYSVKIKSQLNKRDQ